MELPYPNLDYVITGEEASGTLIPGTWGYAAVNRSPHQLLKNDEFLLEKVAGCAELAGASFEGRVFLSSDPEAPLEVATKQYADRKAEPKVYSFQNAVNIWKITHNLNRRVSVSTLDQYGNICHGAITHIDLNTVWVEFLIPVKGTAYLI